MPIARKRLIHLFREHGFTGPLSGGRHQFMAKGSLKIRIPNPHGKDISDSLLNEILKQAGISREAFDK